MLRRFRGIVFVLPDPVFVADELAGELYIRRACGTVSGDLEVRG